MPVAGLRLALVLRSAQGGNLLIQTHGISGRGAQDATDEVAATISKFAAAGGRGNLDGTGDNPPGLGAGHVAAVQGRYCVTYRLVNAVYAMVVAPPGANVFLCMQLLDAVTKVLVGVAKGVDVTPDKLVKRYTEVYLLLESLMSTGLSTLPPAFMHSSATDERLLVLPTSTADAARRFKRMVRGGARSGTTFAPGKGGDDKEGTAEDPTPPPVPETPSSRGGQQFSSAYADPLGAVAFDIPPDALPPPPARAAVARRAPVLAAPLRPTPPPPAFKGAVEEDAAKAAPAQAEGFGAFGEVEVLEANKAAEPAAAEAAEPEGWAQFGDAAEPAAAVPAAEVPAAPALPAVTDKDVKDSLQLTEVWRGEVVGCEVVRAGLEGGVRRRLAPYGLAAARFRLLPAPAGVVNACLRVAAMNRDFAEQLAQAGGSSDAAAGSGAAAVGTAGSEEGGSGGSGVGDSFLAKFTQASVGCCYLQYSLPAVACPPPLQVAVHVVPGADASKPGGASWQGLVVLRYVANPALPGSLLDVAVDLSVPPEASALLRVSPAAQWSREGGQLRWQLPCIPPGGAGELRAVFGCKAGVAAAAATAALARQAQARVLFTLRPGHTLSGLGFQVAGAEQEAAFQPANVQCYGELTVRI